MKILYLSMDFCKYGNNSRSAECYVAEEMAKEHEIIFVTKNNPLFKPLEKSSNLHIEVVEWEKEGLTNEEIKRINGYEYDVVYSTSITSVILTSQLAKMKNAKCVIQVLDCPIYRLQQIERYKEWVDKWKSWVQELPQVDRIVCNHNTTLEVMKELSSLFGVNYSEKLRIVPYGIATFESDKIPEQKKLNQIVFVSNLRFFKGLDIIIYALAQLENKPLLKVVGVADGTEQNMNSLYGPIPLRYVNLAFLAGVPTEFCGGLDDKEKYLIIKQSKLALLPLLTETIPSIFPLEAVYSGTPTIVSDTNINKEAYGSTVTYLNRFDTKLWATMIQEIMGNEEYDVTEQMKEFISNHRSCKSHAEGLLQVFKEALDGIAD